MISIIIPVYNGEKWIKRCIDSLIEQEIFHALQIIIINDGSIDNSRIIIEQYTKVYNNIVLINQSNLGVSAARNAGLSYANGMFLSFLDVDDYVEQDYYAKLLKEAECGADIVCSGFFVEYKDRQIKNKKKCPKSFSNEEGVAAFLTGEEIDPNIWNKLFKRTIVDGVFFDQKIAIAEDKLFLYQCLKKTKIVKTSCICGYHYSMNEASAVHTFSYKKMDSLVVSDLIKKDVSLYYPQFQALLECMDIDLKCRLYGEIYKANRIGEFQMEYKEIQSEIKKFSVIKKMKHSNKKHVIALIAAKIHPSVYVFLKYGLKFQYQ